MQALVLAGGLGTRLRPVTARVPKPMIAVQGCPFLEHVICYLRRQDVREIILCVGYLWEQVRDYFGDGTRLGISLRYSVEPTPLGTGGAVKHAAALIAGDFLLVNGDTYLPMELQPLLRALLADSRALGVLAVFPRASENNLCLDEEKTICAVGPRGSASMTHADAGIAMYRHEVLVRLSASPERFSWEDRIYQDLINERRLRAHLSEVPYYDMGTFDRLKQGSALLA